MKTSSKIAVIAGLGAIAGGAAGYYLNSNKGREQRQKAADSLKEQSAKAAGYVGDLTSKVKSTAADIASKAQEAFATTASKAKEVAVEAKKTYSNGQVTA